MLDIVARLRDTTLDKDNFPRMDSEKWFSVGLAKEAANEIKRLRARVKYLEDPCNSSP
jgi:O-succinylbenzoate synthase